MHSSFGIYPRLVFLVFLGSVILESVVNFESKMAIVALDGSPCLPCDSAPG